MFYEHHLFKREVKPEAKLESAIITLNPTESKRLIAKAVAVLPEVKAALKSGTLIIGWGTTNIFVAEEILGKTIAHKTDFTSGVISGGELNANHPDTQIMPFVLKDGKLSEVHQKAALSEFKPGDVFIKGANAMDTQGNIGILMAGQTGGSMHDAWVGTVGRGGHFICPVGLEKLILSVNEATLKCGIFRFKYSIGLPVSLITFPNARVVTEIQAIPVLTGASATHVASGGIAGSEGAVTLVLEGEAPVIEKAFELVKSVKGEQPVPPPRQYRVPPAASRGYEAITLSEFA